MNASQHTDGAGIQTQALQAVVAVFTRLMRVRVATQDGHQRRMTLDTLRAEFQDGLAAHASQVLKDGVMSPEGVMFRDAFNRLQDDLMLEVSSGLTAAEKAQLGT